MFNLQFFRLIKKKKKIDILKSFLVPFSLSEKLARSFLLKEAKSSPDRKITELLTFDYLFPRYDIFRAKTRTK